jgi:hypothetical protein
MAWHVGLCVRTIDIARQTVEKVVLEKGFKDPKALRTALFHAYPFELRQGYPYDAWLKVIDILPHLSLAAAAYTERKGIPTASSACPRWRMFLAAFTSRS